MGNLYLRKELGNHAARQDVMPPSWVGKAGGGGMDLSSGCRSIQVSRSALGGRLKQGRVDDEEDAFGAREGGAVRVDEFGGVEELPAFASKMAAGEGERHVKRGWAEVVDLHVAGHREDVERSIELRHGLIHEGGDDASVDVSGRPLVYAAQGNASGSSDVFVVRGVNHEAEVKAFGVLRTAAEAEVGALVDGAGFGDPVERVGNVSFFWHTMRIRWQNETGKTGGRQDQS